jgi:uncharacterized repeat protein (TIGR03803 family)
VKRSLYTQTYPPDGESKNWWRRLNGALGRGRRREWTETVLHSFTGIIYVASSDGGSPQAGLITDSKGNLFGTTYAGGASGVGTVFELSPPATAGGAWTEAVLSSFNYARCQVDSTGSTGALCRTGHIVEADGDLHRRSNWKDPARRRSAFRSGGDCGTHRVAFVKCRSSRA